MKIRRSNAFLLIAAIFLGEIAIILGGANSAYVHEFLFEYCLIAISYLVVCISYFVAFDRDGMNFLHPITLVTVLYLCIFVLCPAYLIVIGDTTCHGAYVMDGCVKATLIFLAGYIAMLVGYNNTRIEYNEPQYLIVHVSNSAYVHNKIVIAAYVIWIVSWTISLIVSIKQGRSLAYVISFGTQGYNNAVFNSYGDDGGLAFLGKMSNSMIIPWGIILISERKRIFRIIITMLTVSMFYITGFRYMIVLMVLAYLCITVRVKGKKVKIGTLIFVTVLLIAFISMLGYARANMRLGKQIDWSGFNFEAVEYALVSNFNIFLPFYGLVNTYPAEHFFTLGHSMFYESAIYFIPRAIWHTKPVAKISSSVAVAMMRSTNEFTISTVGMAWPNIGEYYMEFGTIGVLLFMYLFGVLMKKSVSLYNSKSELDVVTYSMTLGVFFQLLTRGYTPNNMGMVVFLYLPLIMLYLIEPKRL